MRKKNIRAKIKRSDNNIPTSQSLFSGSTEKSLMFCEKNNHKSQDCLKASYMSNEERVKKVQESKGSSTCFKRGHPSKTCRLYVKCPVCGGKYFAIMCRGKSSTREESAAETTNAKTNNENVACTSYSNEEGQVLMKTIQVEVIDDTGNRHKVRMLFDEGSNRSYIKTATAKS